MQGMTSNINDFREIHKGKSFAVLGSSPTINLYRGEQDVSIAVNGSVMCDAVERADYFMAGDKDSAKRGWFEKSMDFADSRIIATFIAPFDHLVLSDEEERSELQRLLEDDKVHQREPGGNIKFSPNFRNLVRPHGIFEYADIWEEEICPDQQKLCRGGTISGVACQMALIMGASEVHLYGCSFGTPEQGHYGYNNKNEPGGIRFDHPPTMDYILSRLVEHNVGVYSHGFTKLQVPEEI